MFKGSWQTSGVGIMGAVGVVVHFIYICLAGAPTETDTMILIGGLLYGYGLFLARDNKVTSEQAGAVPPLTASVSTFPHPDIPKPLILLVLIPTLFLAGCDSATKERKEAEEYAFDAHEQAHRNDTASYEKMKAANLVNYQKKKDLELAADLRILETETKLNPNKWSSPALIAAETARLQGLHDAQIIAYKERIAAADAVRARNEAINIAAARQVRARLNPPKKKPALLDQVPEIEASGATPKPPLLIEEPVSKEK